MLYSTIKYETNLIQIKLSKRQTNIFNNEDIILSFSGWTQRQSWILRRNKYDVFFKKRMLNL